MRRFSSYRSRSRYRDSQGVQRPWTELAALAIRRTTDKLGDVRRVSIIPKGDVVFTRVRQAMSLTSRAAHQFRDLSLSTLAQFPELALAQLDKMVQQVHRSLANITMNFRLTRTREGHTFATRGFLITPW